jgi:hypothetical protein
MDSIQALRMALKPLLGLLLDKENKDVNAVSPNIQEDFYHLEEESYRDEEHLKSTKRAYVEPADPFQVLITRPKGARWPVLEYFVDGSIRSIYIGSIQTHRYVFPMHISQIGVAVLLRSKEELKCHIPFEQRFVIVLPISYLGDASKIKINKIISEMPKEISDKVLLIDTVETVDAEELKEISDVPKTRYDLLRMRALRRARYEMQRLEDKVLYRLADDVKEFPNSYVVVDGTLLDKGSYKGNIVDNDDELLKQCIGVSKSFTIRLLEGIELGPQSKTMSEEQKAKISMEYQKLFFKFSKGVRTPLFHLSPKLTGIKFRKPRLSWYLKLHSSGEVGGDPMSGIVRLDITCHHKNRIEKEVSEKKPSSFINDLSYALYQERLPVAYEDRRWHNLLYPIYVVEKCIKSNFCSLETLKGLFYSILREVKGASE